MKRSKIKWKKIERIAVQFEDFGFGRVDSKGISTHGFCPDGLKRFVLAINRVQPHKARKKRALAKRK